MASIRLTYRELAERLGKTPDAARMQAKRMNASGKWRIIPGNHPQDKVYIELPEEDLPPEGAELARPEKPARQAPPPPPEPEPPQSAITEGMVAIMASQQAELAKLREGYEAVVQQLVEAKSAHLADVSASKAEAAEYERKVAAAEADALSSRTALDAMGQQLAALREQLEAQAAAVPEPSATPWRHRFRLRRR